MTYNVDWGQIIAAWLAYEGQKDRDKKKPKPAPLTPQEQAIWQQQQNQYNYDPTRHYISGVADRYLQGIGSMKVPTPTFHNPQYAEMFKGFQFPTFDFSGLPKPWEKPLSEQNIPGWAPNPFTTGGTGNTGFSFQDQDRDLRTRQRGIEGSYEAMAQKYGDTYARSKVGNAMYKSEKEYRSATDPRGEKIHGTMWGDGSKFAAPNTTDPSWAQYYGVGREPGDSGPIGQDPRNNPNATPVNRESLNDFRNFLQNFPKDHPYWTSVFKHAGLFLSTGNPMYIPKLGWDLYKQWSTSQQGKP